MSQCLACYNL